MGGGLVWGRGGCQVEEQGPTQRQVGRCSAGSGPGVAKIGGRDHRNARAGEKGRGRRLGSDQRARGLARRNSSFFNLMKLVSNRIDLIEIKDGLPKI
jgi:hypothetical protein